MSRGDRNHGGQAESVRVEPIELARILRENQKLITLGRLTASIAHEINNPLESITNLLYLIERDKSSKTTEYLRMAQRELERVVQITRKTLSFSRETAEPARVQLAELMEEVLILHARRIGEKNLRIVRQYLSLEQVTVFPGEMRQVLSNLISNAVDAAPAHGRLVLRLRATHRWATGEPGYPDKLYPGKWIRERGLRLSVGDNGPGIPQDVRSRLGQPFFTTKGQSGTGLGLWVTKSLLKRSGGRLQVRSSVASGRHGTVFSFFLPTKLRPLTLLAGGSDAADTATLQRHGLRLVGVDADGKLGDPASEELLRQVSGA
jgi:signal transduction histidine kinase